MTIRWGSCLYLGIFAALLSVPKADPAATAAVSPHATAADSADLTFLGAAGGAGSHALAVDGAVAYLGVGLRLVVVDVSDPAQPVPLGSVTLADFPRAIAPDGDWVYVAAFSGGLAVIDVADRAHPRVVSSLGPLGYPEAVAAGGRGVVYVGGRDGVLRAIDVSQPTSPRELGSLPTDGSIHDLAVRGPVVYVANHPGLRIVNAADPSAPRLWSSLALSGPAVGLDADTHNVYVAAGEHGLIVVDVTNPAAPRRLASVTLPPDALDVAVEAGRAYVADGDNGLRVIDVADPTKPVEVGVLWTHFHATKVALGGSVLFTVDGRESGLRAVDVADPTRPVELGAVAITAVVSAVAVDGTTAYLGNLDGLHVVDVSNPRHPSQRGAIAIPSGVWDLAVWQKIVCVAAGTGGLRLFDVADPAHPRELGSFQASESWYARAVIVQNGLAFVADADGRVVAVDVRISLSPKALAWIEEPAFQGSAVALAQRNSTLFLAGGGLVQIWDVSRPSGPRTVGQASVPAGETVQAVATGGDRVAVTTYGSLGGAIRLLDVSDPSHPRLHPPLRTTGNAQGLVLANGGFAYIADGAVEFGGLRVVDVRDPDRPQLLGSYDTHWAINVTGTGDMAYVAASGEGLWMVDVADPRHPHQPGVFDSWPDVWVADGVAGGPRTAYVASGRDGPRSVDIGDLSRPRELARTVPGGGAWEVIAQDDVVYIAGGDGGLQAFDVSDPRNPRWRGSLDGANDVWALDVRGNTAYVAAGRQGLLVVDVTSPCQLRSLASVPLPGWSRDVAVAGSLAYVIYPVAEGSELQVVDVADPGRPRLLGKLGASWDFTTVAAVDDVVYVGAREGVRVIVASDPQNPGAAGGLEAIDVTDLAVDGWRLAVAGGNGLIQLFDITDPRQPRPIGRTFAPDDVSGVALVGDTVLAADQRAGMLVLRANGALEPASGSHAIYLPRVLRYAEAPAAYPLTKGPRFDWQPADSPDGTVVAYVSDDLSTGTGELRLYAMIGAVDQAVPLAGLIEPEVPTFTSDGQAIVFAGRFASPADWDVYRVSLDGTGLVNLTQAPATDERRPSLSPDGRWLAFDSDRSGNDEIFLLDLETRQVTQLTDHPALDRLPSFSPDGRSILFRSERDGNSEIYRMARDGTAPTRLTNHPAHDGYASYAPDGQSILFQSDRGCRDGIYLMDPDGWHVRALSSGQAHDVTPRLDSTGNWMVLASNRTGNWEVYLLPSAGR